MSGTGKRPTGVRRIERWLVGLVMVVIALILERIVRRSVEKEDAPRAPSTLTSKGGEVDLDDLR